jgi:hypothetical protein
MAFGKFEVHAGDFRPGKAHQLISGGWGRGKLVMDTGHLFRERIPITQVAEIEMASQESATRIGGAIGWGVAGELLFGPAGLLAGALIGGRGTDVSFVCRLRDGRKFVATSPSGIFQKLNAAANLNRWETAQVRSAEVKHESVGVKLLTLGAWAYAILFGLAGISLVFAGDPLTGLMFVASAIVALPLSAKLFEKRFRIATPIWVRAIVAIALLITAGALGNQARGNSSSISKQTETLGK